ncbi:hypothetical protein SAN_0557 [Streptococcus agalactiae COH1]|nr:hypothetical protein SAL_0533 [Streptococcus agalactiae 515]EAO76118.1 hypothetical protein SAN_0557 [Streptococcus agalactiae COH1]
MLKKSDHEAKLLHNSLASAVVPEERTPKSAS